FSLIAVQTSGSGISNLLAVATTFTGSGSLYCQWEHLTWQWECIVHSEPKSMDKGKGILVEEPKPLKKQAQIEQDEVYVRELEAKLNANINWNEVIEQVKRKEKQDNTIMKYQSLKRKPPTEAHARKNMMVYLKNMAGFKMDFFKSMTYDDIRPIFEKCLNSIVDFLEKGEEELEEEASKQSKRESETSKEKAVKKQKLDEEVEELKTHL
nr:hypothetical protein [Tanacetum cinerariifolium]